MFKLAALVLTAVFVAVSYTQTLPPDCSREYTVKPGDFCNLISAQQNVSTFQLANVNPFINQNCTNLQPDEVLCLGIEGQDCDQVSVVKEGDTCESIAAAANITLPNLLDNNPNVNSDCSNIGIDEVLAVCAAPTSN